MSGQIAGWLDAIRVMSRKPPAANRSRTACSSLPWFATFMRVDAASCGTWLTIATSASCSAGGTAIASAPKPLTHERTAAKTSGSVRPVGVRTQVAPTNRSALAPASPSCSEPAIGWPPTKRATAVGRAASTACTTGDLTDPTSVTRGAPASSAAITTSATAPTGTATRVRSARARPRRRRRRRPRPPPRPRARSRRARHRGRRRGRSRRCVAARGPPTPR